MYFVSDAQLKDLFEKYPLNLEDNPSIATDQDNYEGLDTFLNKAKRMVAKPGDWHAGPTISQSTMNTFLDSEICNQNVILLLRWETSWALTIRNA